MIIFLGKYKILLLGLVILWLAYFSLLIISCSQNQGQIVYSLDDAYIHMAMAKNLALHGVWGITAGEFTSSSSSVLWTSLLALLYKIFGVNELIPFALNILFASLVIISSYFILSAYKIKPVVILLILILLVFVTPLPPLMFTGLEHVMHIWISLLFIYFAAQMLAGQGANKRNLLWLVIFGAMLPLVRYEGIFLTSAASLLFFFKRKWAAGILIFVFSFLPVYIFGVISIKNGWSFFPNSLLLKGGFPDIVSFGDFIRFIASLTGIFLPSVYITLAVLVAIAVCVFAYFFFRKRWKNIPSAEIKYLLFFFLANLVLYAAYSKSGWTYRYQSFLVAIGIIVLSVFFFNYVFVSFSKHTVLKWVLVVFIGVIPLAYFLTAGISLIIKTPRASTNIYEQQYQMGQFLKRYYNGRGVALNDIGAANYFADIKCVDLWGLGNLEISKKRRALVFSSQDIREICSRNQVDIAIIYDSWFAEGDSTSIPAEWVKAGEWEIKDNVIAGDDVVSFYAVSTIAKAELMSNLKFFSASLPKGVICRIF